MLHELESEPRGLQPRDAAPRRAIARLVEFARDRFAALPVHSTIELVEHPKVINVPGAAYYSHGLLEWQGHWIPMIDLETMLRAYPARQLPSAPRYALVLAFQRAPGAPLEHGAIALAHLPESVEVADSAACAMPTDSDLWPLLALACFEREGHAVPVLDTTRLFSRFHG